MEVVAPKRAGQFCTQSQHETGRKDTNDQNQASRASVIQYQRETQRGSPKPRLFVSGTEFGRDMSEVVKGTDGTKIFTFPKTVRAVQKDAFQRISLLGSVVLNDGLEVIGEAAFRGTGLRAVRFPTTLREIGAEAFCFCSRLASAEIQRNGGLKLVGDLAFQRTAIDQIALPSTLKEVGKNTFRDCSSLKLICVEDGCGAALAGIRVSPSVCFGPLPGTMAGREAVWRLRG